MSFMSRANTCKEFDNPARKKRLGQYFTGTRLARLLAALADTNSAQSIIDPMGGTGDMLAACMESGNYDKHYVSIEIDPLAVRLAEERFTDLKSPKLTLIRGDAFSEKNIGKLPLDSYDLVITNPPYVRYQSLSKDSATDMQLPNALEVRNNLLNLIKNSKYLDRADRELLGTLVSSYSGFSDLAVPSWFLCALLTKIGGTLAMVVPEAWLTRDYAQVIQYLLLRWFRIKFVIVDSHAVWFPDALVKTTLLVAERVQTRPTAFSWEDEGYLQVQINGQAMTSESIVGNIFPLDSQPERLFIGTLNTLSRARKKQENPFWSTNWISLSQKADNLRRSIKTERWVKLIEQTHSDSGKSLPKNRSREGVVPQDLYDWLEAPPVRPFINLKEMGVNVSQGLRTGANKFFYTEIVERNSKGSFVRPDPMYDIKSISTPESCMRPALRWQRELSSSYQLQTSQLKTRVLILGQHALPEDLELVSSANDEIECVYKQVPNELAEYIRTAAQTMIGKGDEAKKIPELSAVRTNVRNARNSQSKPTPRFWYMLPPLTRRHSPDLFVARVNNTHPKSILNSSEKAVIDANFSTLWIDDSERFDSYALLALLNSTWCIAAMELTGSVLGGGALKLEATHIRRLPIPELSDSQLSRLSNLGQILVDQTDTQSTLFAVDSILIEAMLGRKNLRKKRKQLMDIAQEKLQLRTKKYDNQR